MCPRAVRDDGTVNLTSSVRLRCPCLSLGATCACSRALATTCTDVLVLSGVSLTCLPPPQGSRPFLQPLLDDSAGRLVCRHELLDVSIHSSQ
jgi:hypothetical protein